VGNCLRRISMSVGSNQFAVGSRQFGRHCEEFFNHREHGVLRVFYHREHGEKRREKAIRITGDSNWRAQSHPVQAP
jgi:hypothetical protein